MNHNPENATPPAQDGQLIVLPPEDSTTMARFQAPSGMELAGTKANQLMEVVKARNLSVKIGQGDHLKIEAWTFLGGSCGVFVRPLPPPGGLVPIVENGEKIGYTAYAEVVDVKTGQIVCAGYGQCYADEEDYSKKRKDWYSRWKNAKHDVVWHSVSSMAQTRAASKALSNALRWLVELAGFSGTPYDEMQQQMAQRPSYGQKGASKPRQQQTTQQSTQPSTAYRNQQQGGETPSPDGLLQMISNGEDPLLDPSRMAYKFGKHNGRTWLDVWMHEWPRSAGGTDYTTWLGQEMNPFERDRKIQAGELDSRGEPHQPLSDFELKMWQAHVFLRYRIDKKSGALKKLEKCKFPWETQAPRTQEPDPKHDPVDDDLGIPPGENELDMAHGDEPGAVDSYEDNNDVPF